MMNLLAALPFLFGGGESVPFDKVELGGSVVEQQSGQPFPSPVPVSMFRSVLAGGGEDASRPASSPPRK